MKKIALVFFAVLSLSLSYGQTGKGGWEIDGSGSLKWISQKLTDNDKFHETDFSLRPEIGYFFCAKLVAGLALDFSSYSYHYNDDDPYKYNSFSAGVFAKYYFMAPNQKHNFYAKAGFDFGGSKPEGQDERYNFNKYAFGLGMVCFLNRYAGITFGFDWASYGGEYYTDYVEEGDRQNKMGFCAGLQIFLDPCHKRAVQAR